MLRGKRVQGVSHTHLPKEKPGLQQELRGCGRMSPNESFQSELMLLAWLLWTPLPQLWGGD